MLAPASGVWDPGEGKWDSPSALLQSWGVEDTWVVPSRPYPRMLTCTRAQIHTDAATHCWMWGPGSPAGAPWMGAPLHSQSSPLPRRWLV